MVIVVFVQVLTSAVVTWLYLMLVKWGNWGGGVKTHAATSTLPGDVATLGVRDVVVEVDEVGGGLSWARVCNLACVVRGHSKINPCRRICGREGQTSYALQLGLQAYLVHGPLLGPALQFPAPPAPIYGLQRLAHIPGEGEGLMTWQSVFAFVTPKSG